MNELVGYYIPAATSYCQAGQCSRIEDLRINDTGILLPGTEYLTSPSLQENKVTFKPMRPNFETTFNNHSTIYLRVHFIIRSNL